MIAIETDGYLAANRERLAARGYNEKQIQAFARYEAFTQAKHGEEAGRAVLDHVTSLLKGKRVRSVLQFYRWDGDDLYAKDQLGRICVVPGRWQDARYILCGVVREPAIIAGASCPTDRPARAASRWPTSGRFDCTSPIRGHSRRVAKCPEQVLKDFSRPRFRIGGSSSIEMKFQVQVLEVQAPWGWSRHLKVHRTDGKDGITWDDLQKIKDEYFGPEVAAVEFYPPATVP